MAAGKFNMQKASGGVASITVADGLTNTSIVLPERGTVATTTDLKEIGVGQTWQDVTASRVAGVTYTNSTGKPIEVSIAWSLGGTNTHTSPLLEINGINILSKTEDGGSYANNTVIAIVGAGATYRFTLYSPQIKTHWKELR